MRKIALFVLICLITLTVFRFAIGNEKPITDSVLNIDFDNVGTIMRDLRLNVAYLSLTVTARSDRLGELIDIYKDKGGAWLRIFANRLPGIFSNTKDALYAISESSWVNGNDTWAVVQGHIAYIAEVFTLSINAVRLSGNLIKASAGKLVEVVYVLLMR